MARDGLLTTRAWLDGESRPSESGVERVMPDWMSSWQPRTFVIGVGNLVSIRTVVHEVLVEPLD
jgi:hypothetical protein